MPDNQSWILVVESEDYQRERISNIFYERGHSVISAESIRQAEKACASRPSPTLLLSAFNLKDGNAEDLIARLWPKSRRAEAPTVILASDQKELEAHLQLKISHGVEAVIPESSKDAVIYRFYKASPGPYIGPARTIGKALTRPSFGRTVDPQLAELSFDSQMDLPSAFKDLLKRACEILGVTGGTATWTLADGEMQSISHGKTPPDSQVAARHKFWPHTDIEIDSSQTAPFVAGDTLTDSRFTDKTNCKQGLRAMLATALVSPSGLRLGSLAVFHDLVRPFKSEEVHFWKTLTRRLTGELMLRLEKAYIEGELVSTLEEAEQTEQRLSDLESLVHALDTGILALGEDDEILFANMPLGLMFSLDAHDLEGSNLDTFLRMTTSLFRDPGDFLAKLQYPHHSSEVESEIFFTDLGRKQHLQWESRPARIQGKNARLYIFHDITSRVTLEKQMERFRTRDPITGLPNRLGGEAILAREAARSRRKKLIWTLAKLHVTNYEELAHEDGQEAVDAMMASLADFFSVELRASDAVMRWSKDEFYLLMPEARTEGAQAKVRRMLSGCNALTFTGISLFPKIKSSLAESEEGQSWESVSQKLEG